jgi:ABC-type dipeptide/oligopeptide/nickel transport system permease component
VLWGVSALVFLMSQFIAGDIAETIVVNRGLEPTQQEIHNVKAELGLNDPLPTQYTRWIKSLLKGDFGISYRTNQPVLNEIMSRVPSTLLLSLSTAFVTAFITLLLGVFTITDSSGIVKKFCSVLFVIGTSVPTFVTGLCLIYLFAIELRWTRITFTGTISDYIIPVITLTLSVLPSSLRVFQTSLIEVHKHSFVEVLHSRGFPYHRILINDVLRVSIGPWLSHFSVTLGQLLGGSILVETIFGMPGLGQFMIVSIMNRDYPVIQVYVLMMGVIFVFLHYLVDKLLRILSPYLFVSQGKIS